MSLINTVTVVNNKHNVDSRVKKSVLTFCKGKNWIRQQHYSVLQRGDGYRWKGDSAFSPAINGQEGNAIAR
jgi:hypothetical protein